MTVVDVLADERVRLDGEVLVHFRHVHVVDEVDHALRSRWTVVPASLLLQRFLKHALKHTGTMSDRWTKVRPRLLLQRFLKHTLNTQRR